ncbi:MAG TPA: glycosyltransferase family 4 protein [Gemmatimonadaceae bacterium]|nr:glycosyltransferase family 4 protein [Gemmatimonadaceae bacterium]
MRRRILFLSQSLPFPPHSGVTNRTYHVLRELQRDFDVTLVAFSRRNHQPDASARSQSAAALQKELADVMTPVEIGSEWSFVTKLVNHARSLVSREPYVFYEYGGSRFSRQLKEAVDRASPDLLHLDSMDLYRWLPSLPALPTSCTHHSIESELLRLRAKRIPNAAVRAYMMHQGDLMEKIERRLCPRFDINVMTSETDAERLRALAPGSRTSVVPNGVNVDYFRPTPLHAVVPGRVTFLGPTYMFPNRDAVQFFLAEAWDRVRTRCPESSLHLIGKSSAADKDRFQSRPGVVSQGYVPDIRPHFAEAACAVVPIRVGGGTRLKILDAWAMGKAVVSTSIGCEGLQTAEGRNILIRDDPVEFAEAVIQVLSDSELRERLGREGRATVEQTYAWPVIGHQLNSLYRGLLG